MLDIFGKADVSTALGIFDDVDAIHLGKEKPAMRRVIP
jgi:hypothetical protein